MAGVNRPARTSFRQHLPAHDVLVVSNTTVAPLYLPALTASLGPRRIVEVILADGEAHKTLANAARVLDVLIANRFGRDCALIALGGGVGRATSPGCAACYQRGVAFRPGAHHTAGRRWTRRSAARLPSITPVART